MLSSVPLHLMLDIIEKKWQYVCGIDIRIIIRSQLMQVYYAWQCYIVLKWGCSVRARQRAGCADLGGRRTEEAPAANEGW